MDAVTYMKEKWRMTDGCENCYGCPLVYSKNGHSVYCDEFEGKFTEQAVSIIEAWSKEHPRKTYLMDFLEKFPKAKIEEADFPICRIRVYGGSCNSVLCTECWNKPMEQEVTK